MFFHIGTWKAEIWICLTNRSTSCSSQLGPEDWHHCWCSWETFRCPFQ